MDIQHSRLLKLLLTTDESTTMSEPIKVKFDYNQPPNLKSEVPGEQKLRGAEHNADQSKESTQNGGELSDVKKDFYVPVLTVKKEEAVFTKGDLKLQKVSVSENFSDNNTTVMYKVSNPIYSEVHSEVIKGPQLLRVKGSESGDQEVKLRSRIPKFRHEAEKLIERRRKSVEAHEAPIQQRRSSIPRLRRIRIPSTNNENNNQQTKHEEPKTHDKKRNTEEEFDKIYDELVHSDQKQVTDTKMLKVKVEDTKTIDHTFEEIIHDYEENKIQPIDVKLIKSRIPLIKQKSLTEGQIVKKIPRRYSLKDIALDDKHTSSPNDKSNKDSHNKVNEPKGSDHITSKQTDIKQQVQELADNDTTEVKYESRLPKLEFKKVDTLLKETCSKDNSNDDKFRTSDTHKSLEPVLINETTHPDDNNKQISKIPTEDLKSYESIKVTTPVFDKTSKNKELADASKEIEAKSQNTNDNNNNFTNDDKTEKLILKPPQSVENKEKVDQIPNKNEKYSKLIGDKKASLFKNVEIDEKRESIKKSHEKERDKIIARGKVNELLNKIKGYDQDVPPVRKEVSKETTKKHTLPSKIAVFSKDKNSKTEKYNNITKSELTVKTNKSKIDKKETNNVPSRAETAEFEKVQSNDKDEATAVVLKSNAKERIKLTRSQSVPVETKQIISKTTHFTPPNTPHNEKQEQNDHKDDVEPFLNITEGETENFNTQEQPKALSNANEFKRSITIHVYHKNNERETIRLNNINTQESISSAQGYINSNETKDDVQSNIDNQREKNVAVNNHENNVETKENISEISPKIDQDSNKNRYLKYERQMTLELGTPNDNFSNKTDPFEAINRDVTTEAENMLLEESNTILKGKVNRIINRLDSADASKDVPKKDVIEMPINKSVSSKIAMFEAHSQAETPKFFRKRKEEPQIKPRIINEVLKSQPPLPSQSSFKNHTADIPNIITDENSKTCGKQREIKNDIEETKYFKESNQKVQSLKEISMSKQISEDIALNVYYAEVVDDTSNDVNIRANVDNNTNFDDTTDQNQKVEAGSDFKPTDSEVSLCVSSEVKYQTQENQVKKHELIGTPKNGETKQEIRENEAYALRNKEIMKLETRLKEFVSHKDETNLKKAKSMAELDIVKSQGKVHQVQELFVRMKSADNVLEKNNNNITTKERPRKKSVSEKIALFERKLLEPPPAPAKPVPSTTAAPAPGAMTPEEYQARIEELTAAAQTYGSVEAVTMTLANGVDMPVLSLGTALLDPVLTPYIISAAIEMGFRAIDTGFIYGNEKQIGEAIRAKIDDGTVTRQELFIGAKLWSTHHRRDLVEVACRASLDAMGLEYFDLYLVHNPMSFKEGPDPFPKIANVLQYSEHDYLDAWFGMEDIYNKGLVKSIGVSNFNSEQIARVVEKGRIKPVINQVECHPYLNQLRLEQFCADRNIKLMCYGTLGSKGTPQEYKNSTAAVIDDPLVKVMAAGLGVTPAQLLIRYQLECGRAVVCKASRGLHLSEVLQAQHTRLSTLEVDALHALNKNKRTFVFSGMGDTHKNYPFKIPF